MIDLTVRNPKFHSRTGEARVHSWQPMAPMKTPQHGRDVDRVLTILASARRRQLLRCLLERTDRSVDRQELVQLLAHTTSEKESLEILLIHHHLPWLADAGLIEYDPRSGKLRPTTCLEDLEPLLEACEELEESLA